MPKTRSPEYPAIGLPDAIEKARLVYEKDYQNRVPRKVVAEHMGYKSLSGASLPVLSAMGKYGLLEGRGDETRISDLALDIIAHAPGTAERGQAIREAARRPELFAELDQRFPDGRASDAAIRSYLLTQKFIPAAADAAIRSYRETNQLVQKEAGGYDDGAEDQATGNKLPMESAPSRRREADTTARPPGSEERVTKTNKIRAGLDDGFYEVSALLVDTEGFDRLIKALQVNRLLFEKHTETFDPVTETWSKPSDNSQPSPERPVANVSLMITQAQKVELRERGYTDEQIRDMKPDEAHKVLGLIN